MKLRLVLFLFILFCLSVSAQNSEIDTQTKNTTWNTLKYDASNMFGGIAYTYSRPFHWDKDDLLTLGATASGTLLLYAFDEQTSDYFRGQRDDIPKVIRDYGWYVGSPQNNYAITGGVYLYGLFNKKEQWRRAGVLMVTSATAAGFLQQLSKYLTGRARPRTDKGKSVFHPFPENSDYHSFPSGHAILSMTNAYALGKLIKNPWLKTGVYAIGMIPPVSRLWEGAHWLSDIGLSIAISVFTVEAVDTYLMDKYDTPNNYKQKPKQISWNLSFTANTIGIKGHF